MSDADCSGAEATQGAEGPRNMEDETTFVAWGFDDSSSTNPPMVSDRTVRHAPGVDSPPANAPALMVLASERKAHKAKTMRVFHTMYTSGRPLVFVTPRHYETAKVGGTIWEAFFYFLNELPIVPKPTSTMANLIARVPEFEKLFARHGATEVVFEFPSFPAHRVTIISGDRSRATGFIVDDRLFVLPAVMPANHEEGRKLASQVAGSVRSYLARVATELPAWVDDYQFQCEAALRKDLSAARESVVLLESKVATYTGLKGLLVWKSDPLVDAVVTTLRDRFGLTVNRVEKFIEDLTIVDADGGIQVVVEVKGFNHNFQRTDVNQCDSHRERLGLLPETPAVLICNTFSPADSLKAKDQRPDEATVKHAVQMRVLMVRTLDLLRYLDLVERRLLTRESLLEKMRGGIGWLKVEGDKVEIVGEA